MLITEYIIVGCLSYGESTALISVGTNKEKAEALCSELNLIIEPVRQAIKSHLMVNIGSPEGEAGRHVIKDCEATAENELAKWKCKHGLVSMEDSLRYDKFEIHPVSRYWLDSI